jgi:Family of unknown function (DUF6084)
VPDLEFKVTGVKPATRGLAPLLRFQVEITNRPDTESIQSVVLQAQIRIRTPQRTYSTAEKARLQDLFGLPSQWRETLRERLWTTCSTTAGGFSGKAEAQFAVPCTYDLNIAATKYFYALEEGEVPLLFLFSGTVFYVASDGRLQAQQISWDREAAYPLPVRAWHDLMEAHYPKSAWLYLRRDVFDQLYAYRRGHGLPTWDQTLERLLEKEEVPA